MTLTLLLLRHAKSNWDNAALGDKARPLSARGQRAAPLMARYIVSTGLVPDLVLCSTALRTRETRDLLCCEIGRELNTQYIDDLYLADLETILQAVLDLGANMRPKRGRAVPPPPACVMVIGHNPGIQDCALELIGSGSKAAIASIAEKLPTAGLVTIAFDAPDWGGIEPGKGRLLAFTTPRSLEARS